jgi:hypothetical protein
VNNGPQFTDLSKEAAIAGTIAVGSFELIPAELLIPPEAFVDPKWRIVYAAACTLRSQISDQIVCSQSVSDFIAWHDLDKELQRAVDSTGTIAWRRWPEFADTSQAYAPELLGIKYSLKELNRLYLERQDDEVCSKRTQRLISRQEAIKALQKNENLAHGSNGELPEMESAFQLCSNPPTTPAELIEGILHQGSKMLIGGGSKSFKSWTLLELSLAICAGLPWLGFSTTTCPVLYLNFELPRFAIASRLNQIAQAMQIAIPDTFAFWNLRGYACESSKILPRITEAALDKGFAFIVIDPLYKLLGGKDENLSRDMALLMNDIELLALKINAAVASGLHFAKGNASFKEAIDRIAGSGVLGRDPDTIVTLTQHEQLNAFTVDMILRNFPQQDPFVVRREHPLMLIDAQLDPAKLKAPKSKTSVLGQFQTEYTKEQILESLSFTEPRRTNQICTEVREETGMSEAEFYRIWAVLKTSKLVHKLEKGWCKIV